MREIDLVVVGDLAFDKIIIKDSERTNIGGAAYNAAIGASIVSKKVGVVASTGTDFPIDKLKRRGVDVKGISVVPAGKTPVYTFYQNADGSYSYTEERGLASGVYPEIFPDSYLTAKYIHLASNPPEYYLFWMESLSKKITNCTIISIDIFEPFVERAPELTRAALKKAGLVFMNEKEFNLLKRFCEIPTGIPVVLKKGPLGAVYIDSGLIITAEAPKVSAVDPTGAGDVLAGVFLALRAQRFPVQIALQRAVNTASGSVTNFGVEHILP